MKHADSYLSDNKVCALKSLIEVIGKKRFALYTCLLEHSQAEVTDYCPLSLVDIHKGYLLELERGLSLYESVHKLGAICAARTDDCYCNFFHIYTPFSVKSLFILPEYPVYATGDRLFIELYELQLSSAHLLRILVHFFDISIVRKLCMH